MLAPGKCPDEPGGGRAIGLASGRSGPVPDPLEDLQGSRRSTCAPLAQAPASHGSVGVLSALARTGQPASHARHGPVNFAGKSHVRCRAPFAGIPDESRRRVDNSLKEEYTQ